MFTFATRITTTRPPGRPRCGSRRCLADRAGIFFAPRHTSTRIFILPRTDFYRPFCAGIWFFNESLVQMSLYRFSIYPQLFGCAAVGVSLSRKRLGNILGAVLCSMIVIVCLIRGPFFGAFHMPGDDANYIALCEWTSQNTPVDAMFLVPPDEQSMRLVGRRTIVVNYKAVPQFSAELVQWRDGLRDVLAMKNLLDLPRGYGQTLAAIRTRYDQTPRRNAFQNCRRLSREIYRDGAFASKSQQHQNDRSIQSLPRD